MNRLLLPLAVFLLAFRPGEPVGVLTCTDSSGKVLLRAELPQMSYLDKADLTLTSPPQHFGVADSAAVDFRPKQHRLNLGIFNQERKPAFSFVADKAFFKLVRSKSGPGTQFDRTYTFTGTLLVAGKQYTGLRCTLRYVW